MLGGRVGFSHPSFGACQEVVVLIYREAEKHYQGNLALISSKAHSIQVHWVLRSMGPGQMPMIIVKIWALP